jgi:hypothetical protein
MTRADLMKLFMEDGGFYGTEAGRPYVLRSCFLIKIEVKFDKPYGFDSRSVPDKEFKIVEVSKPYLERMFLD